jgi:hypothetical protein
VGGAATGVFVGTVVGIIAATGDMVGRGVKGILISPPEIPLEYTNGVSPSSKKLRKNRGSSCRSRLRVSI